VAAAAAAAPAPVLLCNATRLSISATQPTHSPKPNTSRGLKPEHKILRRLSVANSRRNLLESPFEVLRAPAVVDGSESTVLYLCQKHARLELCSHVRACADSQTVRQSDMAGGVGVVG
jgi:hypothetical protein